MPAHAVSESRAHVEALLRARKLDRTLTSEMPDASLQAMPCGLPSLDQALRGGFRRGQLSEVVGAASSGRTTLVWRWLGAATGRGESVALIDTFDRFDPASGQGCGIVLSRMLWVRGQALSKTAGAIDPAWRPGVRAVDGPGTLLERTLDRALKSLNLVLQSGVCTAVAIDLVDVPPATMRHVPASTWMRIQRVLEGSGTSCVVMGTAPLARSPEGVTVQMGSRQPSHRATVCWAGDHDRARRMSGFALDARVISPRSAAISEVELTATLDPAI